MVNYAVVGLQWGDEGKAKILDEIIQQIKEQSDKKVHVVRFQGGKNAGHTMYWIGPDGNIIEFITHMSPSGVTSNSDIWIGPKVVFEPIQFVKELEDAEKLLGYNAGVHISERVGISFDYHIALDKLHELKRIDMIGSTNSGISPFHMDMAKKDTRLTFADYISANFPKKLKEILESKKYEFEELKLYGLDEGFTKPFYFDKLVEKQRPIRDRLKDYSCRLDYRLREAQSRGEHIVLEGAQGTMLDVDIGTIPFTTSSTVTAPAGIASVGLSRKDFIIIGIEKFYPTRVGGGYMPTFDGGEFGTIVQKNSGEFGATTGRLRRVGYPDWVISRYSALSNDVDGIYITRGDCVQDLDIRVCRSYNYKGGVITEVPLDLESATAIYKDQTYSWQLWDGSKDLSKAMKVDEQLKGFRQDYVKGGKDSLPCSLQEYLKDHDEFLKISTVGLSIGPKRGETVMINNINNLKT